MRTKRKEIDSEKTENEKTQTLRTKNMEEILKRIGDAETAAASSDDSPIVSESEDNDDEVLHGFNWVFIFFCS